MSDDLADYVARLVADAPPLPTDQVDRLAALLGARTDRPARQAFLDRFERQVDPDGTLPPGERSRRADHARRSYMADLDRFIEGRATSRVGGPDAA